MRARTILRCRVLAAGLVLAACGGGGSDSSTATASTAANTTVPATGVATTTEAATTAPSTAPPTTLPPLLDLSTLPGLLAVQATSCSPEPYPPQEIVENPVICTLKPDGTDVKVVSQPGEDPSGFAFTRDGTHLYYGDPYSSFGYVIDLTTGEHRERKRNEPLRSGVSPDGQLLIYVDTYEYVLTIANNDGSAFPDGSTSRPVVDDRNVVYWGGPTWAPDSVRFAYLSTLSTIDGNDDFDCAEVWIGAIDGTPPVQITHFADNPDGPEGCPESVRWSPTDDRILLHMLGKPAYTVENLYVINADGSNLTALTHGVASADLVYGYESVGSSSVGDWSPDGKFIVFLVADGTQYQLAVMNADGSQVTPITAAPLGITTSLWSLRWSLG